MAKVPNEHLEDGIGPLSIERLEAGLRVLNAPDADLKSFWDENVATFRQTVLVAMRDTTDALLSPNITLTWRAQFERELDSLIKYLELADRYIAGRKPLRGMKLTIRHSRDPSQWRPRSTDASKS